MYNKYYKIFIFNTLQSSPTQYYFSIQNADSLLTAIIAVNNNSTYGFGKALAVQTIPKISSLFQ